MALQKYYPQNTNTDTDCDTTAKPQDMSKVQGTTTTSVSDNAADTPFVEVHTWDINVSGDSPITGTHNVSIDVASMSTGATGRFRVLAIADVGDCGIDASGGYSSNFNSGTPQPMTDTSNSITWGTSVRLRLSIELSRDASQHGNKSVTTNVQDVDTWVEAPWDEPTAGGTNPGWMSAGGWY